MMKKLKRLLIIAYVYTAAFASPAGLVWGAITSVPVTINYSTSTQIIHSTLITSRTTRRCPDATPATCIGTIPGFTSSACANAERALSGTPNGLELLASTSFL